MSARLNQRRKIRTVFFLLLLLSSLSWQFFSFSSALAEESLLAPQGIELVARGPMIEAHRKGSFYANWSSVFTDGKRLHSFYCSSTKPFVPGEGPEWGTNERTTFYAADTIRYEVFDRTTLAPIAPAKSFLAPSLSYKPVHQAETMKAEQSPCTSSTVFFRGQYYTFFESFTEGAEYGQMVSVHVARTTRLGESPEILTVSGWQPAHTTRERWKPIILSKAFEVPGKYQWKIQEGLRMARETWGAESHGNLLWGLGVPSAVVKDDKIFLVSWDNLSYPDECRYQKNPGGGWSPIPGTRCGRNAFFVSEDGVNFRRLATPEWAPGGDLKVIRDPASGVDGHFAVLGRDMDDSLKARGRIGMSFFIGSPDMQTWVRYPLAEFPTRVPAQKYGELGGIFSFRMAGNELGEVAPFSQLTHIQVGMPRTRSHSNPNSIAENSEIYAWNLRIRSLAVDASPILAADPPQNPDPVVTPELSRFWVLGAGSGPTTGLHLCGGAFSRQAHVRLRWSDRTLETTFTPNAPNPALKAIHFISNERDPKTNHPYFCARVPLTAADVNQINSGKTLTARIFQPGTGRVSPPLSIYRIAPVISQPIIGAKTNNAPAFAWTIAGSVGSFAIDLSQDPNFNWYWRRPVEGSVRSLDYGTGGWLTVNTSRSAPTLLFKGQTYYLRVTAYDSSKNTLGNSAVHSFQVKTVLSDADVKVKIKSPLNGSSVQPQPVFRWAAQGEVGMFTLELSEEAAFSWYWSRNIESSLRTFNYVASDWNAINTERTAPSPLVRGKTYFARLVVYAIDGRRVVVSQPIKMTVKVKK